MHLVVLTESEPTSGRVEDSGVLVGFDERLLRLLGEVMLVVVGVAIDPLRWGWGGIGGGSRWCRRSGAWDRGPIDGGWRWVWGAAPRTSDFHWSPARKVGAQGLNHLLFIIKRPIPKRRRVRQVRTRRLGQIGIQRQAFLHDLERHSWPCWHAGTARYPRCSLRRESASNLS